MNKNHFTAQLTKNCICRFYILPVLLICCIFLAQSVSAQSIGNWAFNGVLTGTPSTFNTVSTADYSGSVPTHSFNGGTEYFGENGWPTGVINTSMYMQFTLTPLTGYQLDISTLVLRLRRSNTGSPAGSGPTGWTLRSSLDGYTTNIATGSMTHNYADYTITPGAGFINIYTAVTFRLYGYNATVSSGGSNRFVIDNIKANGVGYLLPVRLGAFTASAAGQYVRLLYTVYQTEKNDRYFIERSVDGINFSSLHSVEEAVEAAEKNYTYTDDISLLTGIEQLFYRLRLRNKTGADTYSGIITVRIKGRQAPVKTFIRNNQLCISGIFKTGGIYKADLYTVSGMALTHISFSAVSGYNTLVLAIHKQVPAGCIIRLGNDRDYTSTTIALTN